MITLDFANEFGQEESEEEQDDVQMKNKKSCEETDQQKMTKDLLVKLTDELEQGAIFPAHVAMEIYA